jgi:tetratricopeptide (TPR) repeat protein
LRGAIDWSFDLLDANEKRLFARLGVFNQGWNFAAAETVAGEGLDIDILDGMGSLIDKSLMRQFERENGEPRFTMLETIREYALEKLDESGEGEEVRVKHARYYRLFAEEADNDLRQANQVLWLKQLDLEQGNFKAAITWLIENPNTEKLEIALGLAGTLWRFWAQRGYVSEGLHLIVQVLAKSKNDEKLSGSRAKAANGAGNLAWVQGDYTQALSMLEDSLQLRRQQGNEDEVASALQNMGNLALEQGDHAKAGANYRECLELRRKLGVKSDIAIALQNLGNLTLELEELTEAKDYFTEALSLYRDMGDKRGAEAAQSRLRLINSRL